MEAVEAERRRGYTVSLKDISMMNAKMVRGMYLRKWNRTLQLRRGERPLQGLSRRLSDPNRGGLYRITTPSVLGDENEEIRLTLRLCEHACHRGGQTWTQSGP